VPGGADARSMLLERVVGTPSAELEALLERPSREAAVLVGLVARVEGLHVLLTERAAHLPDHPGQISFPGGRLASPDEGYVTAALREATEEVGLPAAEVEVLGRLPPRLTGTGFAVTPVVGWLSARFVAKPDPAEVESAFWVPLAHLRAAENTKREVRERFGTRFLMDEYRFDRHRIWGATAAILTELLEVIDAKTI
jgi:8-oxo-dGTP pyrophosphatase MutT (NUDIX family)